MNHAKKLTGIVLSVSLLAAGSCLASSPANEQTYQAAVNEAKSALKQAADTNNLWRDSEIILAEADKAAKAGDFSSAIALAEKARRQGELAQSQASKQDKAGPM